MKKEVGLLHLAVMLFGLAGVIGKFVTLPAILITFGRVSFSSIFLLIIILIKKEKVRLSNKKDSNHRCWYCYGTSLVHFFTSNSIINCCNWNNYFFNFSTFCDFFRTASIS